MALIKKKMDEKVELTLHQLKDIFMAGELFQEDYSENGDDATELDFGDYLKEFLDIEIDE